MCGIIGILNLNGETADPRIVERMSAVIIHRGPDDEGYFTDGPVGLGFRRLSIIDLSGGRQPMANEDDSVHVVFNGEIYNFQELRKELEAAGPRFQSASDTEVIVHGYEEWGEAVVPRLNGMFAFAAWNTARQSLLLARDRIGIKPLYYCTVGGTLAFAPDIKSRLHLPGFSPEVNERAVMDYFSHLYVPGPASIYQDVLKLQPGHLLVAEKGSIKTKAYWAPTMEFGPER
ncbi:MAG: asparagine synthetase B, partial [Deltaproteobacteria bacterium]|nr:asparagine synthetase B [Deltaproteobacteria bacterium]